MRNFKLLDILKESREFGKFLDQYEKIWDRRSARQQARRVPGVSRQGTGATPTLGISRQDLVDLKEFRGSGRAPGQKQS